MKTAISVPDETFRRVEERAAQLHMNRSEFYATAAERFLDELDRQALTGQIDDALSRIGATEPMDGIRRLEELTADDQW